MTERRILLTGQPKAGKLTFLKALTGSLPAVPADSPSHAGLSHSHAINTQYYKADVPIWVDEFTPEGRTEWAAGYLGVEAKDVRQVLGAFAYTFRLPADTAGLDTVKADLEALAKIVKACGYHWDGISLAIGMPPTTATTDLQMSYDDWDDLCRDYNFEYIDYEARGRNDYGEPTGMERIREALESNDWSPASLEAYDLSDDDNGDGQEGEEEDKDGNVKGGLKLEANEMEREMFGLHQAIYGDNEQEGEEEVGVEKLEEAMMKLMAVRDMAGDLPEAERRKVAAKAVADVMKTI